nr:hypothetical protein SHINE37_41444 [Rhizobiaceae bacterium]
MLPIVSKRRWEEECVVPNSMSFPACGARVFRHHAGRFDPSAFPFLCRPTLRGALICGPDRF